MRHLLSNGDTFDNRYEVISYHSEGGMQEVYRAQDLKLQRLVALKIPKSRSAHKRFAKSAIASARVNHKNVAKAFDYIPLQDSEIFIEEFIEGFNLQELLDDYFYYFDPHLLTRFAQQMIRGLAASHHVGVIHRDIKPANIMVTCVNNKLLFKITDFGIAKLAEEVLDSFVSNTVMSSTVLGALPYMAPELIQSTKNASPKSDIWSFGALLYHLLYGMPPYGYGLDSAVLIKSGVLPSLNLPFEKKRQYEPLTHELIEIIKNCLENNPKNRPTADVLIDKLSSLCYCDVERGISCIKRYGVDGGEFGFTYCNKFLHAESFWGGNTHLQAGQYVYFGIHGDENRVHPVIPLKESISQWQIS